MIPIPAKYFLCPDGEQIEIKKCLGEGCRLKNNLPGGRCLLIPTLRMIAAQRNWNGTPSTTQLLKGIRESYLEIVTDFAINPQDAIFRIIGSKSHGVLDQYTGYGELGEERLTDDISSGQFDLYTDGILADTKTSGSYKVLKALGLRQIDVPTGGVYKTDCKSGKKGEAKTRKEWVEGGHRDRLDWAIQLNDYRMKIESLGFPVHTMVVQALCRDGGTYIAQQRGINFNGILIPINKISDHWVRKYMKHKATALHRALQEGIVPPHCRKRETWAGKKCSKYCNVAKECSKHLTIEEINERLVG